MSAENPFLNYLAFDAPVNAPENQPTRTNYLSSTKESNPVNVGASSSVSYNVRFPYLKIIEQPAAKELRFRYLCEIRDGRSAGSIPGIHSTTEHKTYPTVCIVDYAGPVVIVVSCVTPDEPFRAHPHKLVGTDCKNGVCTVKIDVQDNMTKSFAHLGIQCVKRNEIRESLELRRQQKLFDPFRLGLGDIEASSINLNAVRLCFQAFLVGSELSKSRSLTPVVSEIIYDKKTVSDLVITKLSHCSAPASTRQDMILLCEKVVREDIQIVFFEEIDDEVVWTATGDFTPAQVHKQVAISFITPKYTRVAELDQSVKCFIQLRRPSDGAVSEALQFKFIPEVKKRPPPRPMPSRFPMMPQHIQVPSNESIHQLLQLPVGESILQHFQIPGVEPIQQDLPPPGGESMQQPMQLPLGESMQQHLQQPGVELIQQHLQQPGVDSIQQHLQPSAVELIQQLLQLPGVELIQQHLQQPDVESMQLSLQLPGGQQPLQLPPGESIQQYPQVPGGVFTVNPDILRLLQSSSFQAQILNPLPQSLQPNSISQNPTELPSQLPAYERLPNEPALPPSEPPDRVIDEPEPMMSTSELFPPNVSMTDPTLIEEMLISENMMNDSLTNLVNNRFEMDHK